MTAKRDDITAFLKAWGDGDRSAFDRLVPLVYDDLRRIAHRHLQLERQGHTLNTTALVHEAYVKLADQDECTWRDRACFFAMASRVMRNILVDHARRRRAQKRGGDRVRLSLDEGLARVEQESEELLALDEALEALGERDARLERVVECRFFGGMKVEETAEALGVSKRTVERDWTRAKAYLYRALHPETS
jgi:RNA polymerase sigma factor (TIGR02999 family)